VPVTAADIDHVRAAFDEFNVRFELLRSDAGLKAYHEDFFVPECVIDNVESFPVPKRYQGFEGYRSWFDETLAPYEGIQWRVQHVEPIGERVFTLASISGREPGDPTLIEVRLALNYTLRDRRISRIDVYLNHEAAREAASGTA
jgi:hypothetical protein